MLMKSIFTFCSMLGLLVGLSVPAGACQIPVFRYALENWLPEPYLLIVAHRGGMSDEDTELLSELELAVDQVRGKLNLDLKVVDLSQTKEPVLEAVLGENIRSIQAPQMVLIYPFRADPAPPAAANTIAAVQATSADAAGRTAAPTGLTPAPLARTSCPDGKCNFSAGGPRIAWSGALTGPHVAQLVTSPVRTEIAKQLIAGHSAVWVFVDSGDPAKDNAAVERLETTLAKMEKDLKLPDKQELVADEHYKPETKVDLKIAFSVVRIPASHEEENVFVSTLLHSDPALKVDRQPLAIAVFGQGRSYFPLTGDGIDAASVEEHCRFLTGDCSCEVKEANPGIDLLFAVPWQKSITRISGREHESPELMGIGVLGTAEAISLRPAETARSDDTKIVAGSEQAMSARAESPTSSPHAAPTTTASATEAFSDRAPLTWILGSAAVGLGVILLGTIWLRMGR